MVLQRLLAARAQTDRWLNLPELEALRLSDSKQPGSRGAMDGKKGSGTPKAVGPSPDGLPTAVWSYWKGVGATGARGAACPVFPAAQAAGAAPVLPRPPLCASLACSLLQCAAGKQSCGCCAAAWHPVAGVGAMPSAQGLHALIQHTLRTRRFTQRCLYSDTRCAEPVLTAPPLQAALTTPAQAALTAPATSRAGR